VTGTVAGVTGAGVVGGTSDVGVVWGIAVVEVSGRAALLLLVEPQPVVTIAVRASEAMTAITDFFMFLPFHPFKRLNREYQRPWFDARDANLV
jgi:hypothetical protein